jgi:hypothetical protein
MEHYNFLKEQMEAAADLELLNPYSPSRLEEATFSAAEGKNLSLFSANP